MKTKLSSEYKASIAENISDIKRRIEQAKKQDSEVTLLLATKTVPAEAVNYATQELGVRDIGENRVQELLSKYDELEKENVNIHFIGSLQTNKVKYIIDKVCMIHSVDSLKLAAEIDRQAKKHNKVMDILVEINIGEEENKGGIAPDELEDFLEKLTAFEHLRVRGLMTIAPFWCEKADYQKYFAKTYQFFIDILPKKIHNIYKPVLSMGMSDSFETAIECGSTLVRLGTVVFGHRQYK
ncbi:MAG: YggS family pyridoxal phosphate-dependent enzyme [Clostridia bacterium]|nr:YggS family pyridoxal phosphate-dependent enzyme [Clostridia bacterium]MBQ4561769.1 YggS family pyridoxal phosphate-dependent enzyme [Clostridia bacterium]